jgi:hypothetical protein
MPYFGNKLLNPSIFAELCLIAKEIEGFKSLLPKYGMRCT